MSSMNSLRSAPVTREQPLSVTKFVSRVSIDIALLFFTAAALANIVLVGIGIYKNYTPIPGYDEWLGTVGFLHQIANHDVSAWFSKFNDHRIVLQRISTWIDYDIFGGKNVFSLLFISCLYVAMIVAINWKTRKHLGARDSVIWTSIVTCIMLNWVQNQIMTWAFQVQFIGAYSFSVLSFIFYAESASVPDSKVPLALAIIFGLFSAGSMANGPLVFPVLVLQAILLKRNRSEIFGFTIISVVIFSLYFYDKIFLPSTTGIPTGSLSSIAMFLLRLLGGPLWLPLGSDALCICVGALCIICTIVLLYLSFNANRMTTARTFYIATLAFCLLSGVIISIGRSLAMEIFGLVMAYSSRYMIVPILYWSSLLLLALDLSRGAGTRAVMMAMVAPLIAVLTVYQWHAADDTSYLFDRKLGVLSYKIGLGRKELVPLIFVGYDRFLAEAAWAAANRVGVYGSLPWLRDAGAVQFDRAHEDDRRCYGVLERIDPDPRGDRISGWAVSRSGSANLLVLLVDREGRTVGYGVTGATRHDLESKGLPSESGWVGFAKVGSGRLTAYLYLDGRSCRLSEATYSSPPAVRQ